MSKQTMMSSADPRLLVVLVIANVVSLNYGNEVVITVDVERGDDNQCMSAIDIIEYGFNDYSSAVPCSSLDYAISGNLSYSSIIDPTDCGDDYTSVLSNVRFVLRSGVYRLSNQIIGGSKNISFQADSDSTVILVCNNTLNDVFESSFSSSLFLCDVDHLVFEGITFADCGPPAPVSNVIVYGSSDVTFESCVFENNGGTSLAVHYTRQFKISNSVFRNNTNQVIYNGTDSIVQTSAGAVAIVIGADQDTMLTIDNCTFTENTASRNSLNDTRPVLLKQNGHGGAIYIKLNGTTNSIIEISNSEFINNYAEVDGGGVYISYSNNAESNHFKFNNLLFKGNTVQEAAGGAISTNSFNHTYNNIFTISNCSFISNSASAGGGFSVALYDSDLNSTKYPDGIQFSECNFINNEAANEGTAVGLFSLVHVDQVGFPVDFSDCLFQNNTSTAGKDTSAVAAFRFPMNFNNTNQFINNTGGGIMLLNTRMVVSGDLLFHRNRAMFGGGIMMDDRCLLEVTPHVNMTFSENTASESGGGIYVEFPPIRFVIDIFNRLCFLQYSNPEQGTDVAPQDWKNVTIRFIGNNATLSGAAIYANDMQRCSWLGNHVNTSALIFTPHGNLKTPFSFINNNLDSNNDNVVNRSLATAPRNILPSVKHSEVQPGERLAISLRATDQLGNTREAIWALDVSNQDTILDALSADNDTYFYTIPVPSPPIFCNKTNVSVDELKYQIHLNFSLLKTLGLSSSLSLTVNPCCHPGFFRNDNGSCECDSDHTNILRCDDNKRYIYLREGIYGSWNNATNEFITPRVLPGYTNCTHQGRLPGCLFMFDDEDRQCVNGRKDTLCGACRTHDSYAVTLDLQSCTNTGCSHGVAAFVLLSCIGVIVLCFVILWFNIPIPNELKAFIFYAQVIGLVYRPYSVITNQNSGNKVVSVIVNLLGFSNPIPLCVSKDLSAQYVALFGYIPPLIIFCSIAVFAFGARLSRRLARHSALKGITTLSVFFYKYIADTSFVFLSCVKTDLGFVFQYDGTTQCDTPYFGFFFALALLIVSFFVLPLPFFISFICIKRPQYFQAYADVLTDGLKTHHHWWGGWDIFRRLPFVLISFFVVLLRPSLILFFMSIAALVVMIVHILSKPYKEKYTNVIEAVVLLDLLLVTGAFLDPSSDQVPEGFAYFLIFLPYVYCIGYIIWFTSKHIIKKFTIGKGKSSGTTAESHQPSGLPSTTTNISADITTTTTNVTTESDETNEVVTNTSTKTNSSSTSTTNEVKSGVQLREPLLEDILL